MNTEASSRLLDRVRKLLAKAEAECVTAAEAQALTAKAAELMAKYGIDRALLAARRPETDRPDNRIVQLYNPWARVQAHLLCGLAAALRSDRARFETLHAYFLNRLVPVCAELLAAAAAAGEIRADVGAYELLLGIGNLCVGVDGDSRYDARRMAGLLIAGLGQ